MKPRNFPGRKALRRDRAIARAAGTLQPCGAREVINIGLRYGASQRDVDGRARPSARMDVVGKKGGANV